MRLSWTRWTRYSSRTHVNEEEDDDEENAGIEEWHSSHVGGES